MIVVGHVQVMHATSPTALCVVMVVMVLGGVPYQRRVLLLLLVQEVNLLLAVGLAGVCPGRHAVVRRRQWVDLVITTAGGVGPTAPAVDIV